MRVQWGRSSPPSAVPFERLRVQQGGALSARFQEHFGASGTAKQSPRLGLPSQNCETFANFEGSQSWRMYRKSGRPGPRVDDCFEKMKFHGFFFAKVVRRLARNPNFFLVEHSPAFSGLVLLRRLRGQENAPF